MIVDLIDGRSLKVFVTNTYYFTDYTFDRVISIDPAVDAIICSCPAGMYSDSAKALCIENGIGLFMLNEFMGAIRKHGEDYLNYLTNADRDYRARGIGGLVKDLKPSNGISVYTFGSYLRRKIYSDIDLMLVYTNSSKKAEVNILEKALSNELQRKGERADIVVASSTELPSLKLQHNNLTKAYPL